MRLCKVSHEMALHLELLAAVADVASVGVKGNSSLEYEGQVEDWKAHQSGFESLLVVLAVA
jgi:hypothetical protein